MSTPLSTPVRQAKLGISSTKSYPLANEYKKLLNEQYQRLWLKHQQDLDLIDDIRSYVKARLSIEKDYTSAINKLAKQHLNHVNKKFTLLNQRDPSESGNPNEDKAETHENEVSDSRLQKRLANNGLDEPDRPCSLYKVWFEHINRLQSTSKNRSDQFEQLIIVADKLKDIRSHKATTGKKCLDTHLKRIHEDVVVSMVDVEKARKLYYEDESQAKKARENEEKIKKKRSGLLTKFTDLQAKKEKTSAQREANDIQSTQARNDYIMALAAANAHLQHYYEKDLNDFIHLIDDGVLDHCKIFMATLSECDINSLKDALAHAQYWSKMINLTGSQKTNSIFFECEQSACLRIKSSLSFEPCNNDQIKCISLEHNADYALQHEIDKWFTWFKKECRNLSQLMHQLEMCQRAFSEGKKTIEMNGQNEDLEPKIVELKQLIRKSEAAKMKAQARLKVIKEGGMQIEEWSAVESEIRADMARAQEELEARRAKEIKHADSSDSTRGEADQQAKLMYDGQADQIQVQVSKNSDDSEAGDSIHNLASVSRSTSNIIQKQQNAISGYSALTDPSLVWQEDYSSAWGNNTNSGSNYNVVVTDTFGNGAKRSPTDIESREAEENRYNLLGAGPNSTQQNITTSMTVQSSSPLSAIIDGGQSSPSQYQGMPGESYKSDYECDYSRNGGHLVRSTASSAEPYNQYLQQGNSSQVDPFGKPINSGELQELNERAEFDQPSDNQEPMKFLNQKVIALYSFDKTNDDDLAFNENDILRVVEINDANWAKAKNEATGEIGFIPVSYINLLDEKYDEHYSQEDNEAKNERNIDSIDSDRTWENQNQYKSTEPEQCYCRALYDYTPDANTYEDDGLPHLSLIQGEIMKIIDQGEDDGWWLVEKDNELKTRGHVPSMLVEEMDLVDGENDEGEDYEDENVSQYSYEDNYEGSIKAMPNFEPPKLQKSIDSDNLDGREGSDANNNVSDRNSRDTDESKDSKDNGEPTVNSSSLIPTSFIIIEPTPEVESRRIDESADTSESQDEESDQHSDDRKIVQGVSSKPPNDVSYSVINEEFVLEKPTRKPHQQAEQIQRHETPTILEEMGEEAQTSDSTSKMPADNYETLTEVDDVDIPPPPCVVIEVFEDDRNQKSHDSDHVDDDANSLDEYDGEQTSNYVQKEIKHTGNVDVNPLLRHRAEEFSKQIIAEAIMLAPGADVGPSTSSANTY